MNIADLKKHVEALGCEVTGSTPFSMTANCGNGTFIVKEPESRLKVIVTSENIDKISRYVAIPKIAPREVTIGKFSKQGPWSKILKLGNLDEVEYIYGEDELINSRVKPIKDSMERMERANKFAYMTTHDGIDPLDVVKREIDSISSILTRDIENGIASRTGNNVICGNKNLLHKSWTQAENEKYRFLLKIGCKVPALLDPVTEKLENIGTWKTMSESDRFYIKSIVPPFNSMFLTGIKLVSNLGKDQLEFEAIDDGIVKKKNILENINMLKKDGLFKVNSDEFPVDVDSVISGAVPGYHDDDR